MATLERRPSLLTLKQALLIDAIVSGTVGLLSLVGARWLDSLLDLPAALLAGSGAIMAVYAVGLVMLGNRARVPASGARIVIGGNLVWAAACVLLLFSGWVDPNGLGVAFILAQIVAVLVFAELQAMALRASP
jgi:hypothetical protein